MDCFVASLLAMTVDAVLRSRGAMRPKFSKPSLPEEGAGNAGCTLHPRSRVQTVRKKRTRAYRYSRNTPAFPAQWLYGLCRALLGDEFVLSPSLANLRLIKPGRVDFASAQLDTSNGCQDHTVLPYATTSFVLRAVTAHGKPPCEHTSRPTLPRPPHPIPTSVTIAIRPSWRG